MSLTKEEAYEAARLISGYGLMPPGVLPSASYPST